MIANTPNTAPAATAAAPRAMPPAFWTISALASSISSRIRTETRSETSVTALASESGRMLSLSGKARQDLGKDESAGKRRADHHLGPLGDRGPGGGGLRS